MTYCRARRGREADNCLQLASYSQSNSYSSLGKSEQYDHVPIHPNEPDSRVKPSILYLRRRQGTEMLLKKKSWVNTRRVYKVPVSILRPYETFQSWCRYRLADTSIQALQSVLFISASDSSAGPAPAQFLFSPVSSEGQILPDDVPSSADAFWSPFGVPTKDLSSQQTPVAAPDGPIFDGPNTGLGESQVEISVGGTSGSDNFPERSDGTINGKPRIPLSYKQSPFHIIFPFDAGPLSRTRAEHRTSAGNQSLLPSPVTSNTTPSRRSLQQQTKSTALVCVALIGIWILVGCLFVFMRVSGFVSMTYLQSRMSMVVERHGRRQVESA